MSNSMFYLRCQKLLLALAGASLLVLAVGCSGGSGKKSAANVPPVVEEDDGPGVVYNGPSPATVDVQNFKVHVWDNIAESGRCGGCHGTSGQSPAFARSDDINQAYALANGQVNLNDPVSSRLVTKVLGGHNCWVQSTQFCADQITAWITSWATNSGVTLTETALRVPEVFEVSSSLTFPEDTAAFASLVHEPLLKEYCADCHRADAPQAPVQPYFASSDLNVAYAAAQTKMLFNVQGDVRDASRSRLVVRLREEAHNCWDNNCLVAGNTMEAALEAFAATMEMRELDSSLLSSKAMRIGDGTAISQGGRVETNAVAIYNFKEGSGTQANDSSTGFPPELTLNLIGDVEWVSNWGVRINGGNGRVQGAVEASSKLRRYITQTGEYSIEAWVVPANVTQEGPARIVSYSGSNSSRNFTLGQTLYNYNFLNRTSTTNGDGMPMVSTPDADEVLQATLQHVVASYDAINGRRLYVNGEPIEVTDPVEAGNLNQWDDTFALVLGNETSGEYPWQGTIRFLAIHNRVLTGEQVQANYEVGVGQKILVAFNVGELIEGMDDAYIVFQVEQFDDYSYLFNKPYFFSFSETPASDIVIQGLRIGVNGREAKVGQVFANINATITASGFSSDGVPLSSLGAVIEAEKGPEQDQFFLSFDRIGSLTHERVEEAAPPAPEPEDLPAQPRVGVRTFAEINASLSAMTGIPVTDPGVVETFEAVKQQMPPAEDIKGFLVAHQMGITQLAVKYCNVLANSQSRMQAMFPAFNGTTFDSAGRDALIGPLLRALLAHQIPGANAEMADQPFELDSRERLHDLMDTMTAGCSNNQCSASVASNTVTAVCAAALGSAVMLVQ